MWTLRHTATLAGLALASLMPAMGQTYRRIDPIDADRFTS